MNPMVLGKISFYSRKIHRINLWFMMLSGLAQMITGLAMKYPKFFSLLPFNTVFSLHVANAGYFSIFLTIAMVTGLIMYFTPALIKRLQTRPTPPPQAN